MDDVKPWHVVVMVLGVLVLGIGGWVTVRNGGPPVSLANTMIVADVVSGDLYEINRPAKGLMIPVRNPKTGAATLFPVSREEDGRWVIPSRYRASIAKDPKPVAMKDAGEGVVEVVSSSPTKLKISG